MISVVSNFSAPIPVSSIYEAEMVLSREYNLKLADILIECSIANPVRQRCDNEAFIIWKGKTYSWRIEINGEEAA